MSSVSSFQGLSSLAKQVSSMENNQMVSRLKVEDVVPQDVQVRTIFKDIEELGESIKAEGQIQPIVVSPMDKGGKYRIQKGERRWRAHIAAGLTHIDAIVRDDPVSDLDRTSGELAENIQRDNLKPMEIALALNEFKEAGWSVNSIAERIKRNKVYVSTHLSLLKMPECVKQIYDTSLVMDVDTLNILRSIFELDERKCKALCNLAVEQEGVSRRQCREILNDIKKEIKSESEKGESSGVTNNIDRAPEPEHQPEGRGVDSDALISVNDSTSSGDIPEGEGGEGKEYPIQAVEPGGESHDVEPVHAEPAASKSESNKSDSNDWIDITEPSALTIAVRVVGEESTSEGVIATDRVSKKDGYVWVRTVSRGKSKLRLVHANDLDLLSVSLK